MSNNKNIPENDILGAIIGAALLSSMADEAKKAKTEQVPENEVNPKPETNEHIERAQELRNQYDAFLAVGFTEEQATAFIAALLS